MRERFKKLHYFCRSLELFIEFFNLLCYNKTYLL